MFSQKILRRVFLSHEHEIFEFLNLHYSLKDSSTLILPRVSAVHGFWIQSTSQLNLDYTKLTLS